MLLLPKTYSSSGPCEISSHKLRDGQNTATLVDYELPVILPLITCDSSARGAKKKLTIREK